LCPKVQPQRVASLKPPDTYPTGATLRCRAAWRNPIVLVLDRSICDYENEEDDEDERFAQHSVPGQRFCNNQGGLRVPLR
jgi:hypothetical protein